MRMQKKKKPKLKMVHPSRLLFLLLVGFLFICSFFVFRSKQKVHASSFPLPVAHSVNENYAGVGQEPALHKDGYTTTFTTIEKHQKTYLEYKQNGKASWANMPYWGGTMSDSGCGITALSIILSGYGKNVTPEDLRKTYAPHLDSNEIPSVLRGYNISCSEIYYAERYFTKDYLKRHLLQNRPVLICVWTQNGENIWTTSSHYLVLLATDGLDQVYVSNPNGEDNTPKCSAWYSFDDITPYIAKALFIESD